MSLSLNRIKPLLFIPCLVGGVAVLLGLKACSRGPVEVPVEEFSRTVRVITAQATEVQPRALGYGTAQPGKVWRAAAQVSGKIVFLHDEFDEGATLRAGTEILRIDPSQYAQRVKGLEAQVRQIVAQRAELEVSKTNLESMLALEKRTLELAARELERKRGLLASDAVSASAVDAEERNFLAQSQQAQQIENDLGLIPSKNGALTAQQEALEAQLEDARYDLANTVLTLPFDARISSVPVEIQQFVATGSLLVEADGIDRTEIVAEFPIHRVRPLIPRGGKHPAEFQFDAEKMIGEIGLTARVTLREGDFTVVWEARVVRIRELIDPKTRTVGVIVAVDDPYEKAVPGVRPPLLKGMFCEVELLAPSPGPRVVIPRSAWHEGEVHLSGKDNRLIRREAEPAFFREETVVLESGVSPGEKIVVSDLAPAIEGMLLKTVDVEP